MRSMASSSSSKGIAAIVGVGPKLGRSIARKFAHEGYTVAILARDLGRLSRFADEIAREEKAQVFAIRIDCSDSTSVREAFEGVLSLGFVEVLVYNAYQSVSWHPTNFTDIKVESFEKSLAVSSIGAFLCVQKGERNHSLHWLLSFTQWRCWFLSTMLWKVCPESVIPMPGKRIPASGNPCCPYYHRRGHWFTQGDRVVWGAAAAAKRQSGRGGRGGDDDGPGRLGSDLLALACSGPDCLDPGN